MTLTAPASGLSFGFMLQFYDKVSFHKSFASALALAVLGLPAAAAVSTADTNACDLTDGYAAAPAAFAAEVEACASPLSSASVLEAETRISALSERRRAQYGLGPLEVRESLQRAARAHAMDMASRDFAAHESPEGLDHLDRIRRLDRTALFGPVGANIVIAEADADSIGAFNTLVSDPVNSENILRDTFSHTGVGAARRADGRLVVVQLFAKIDAELDAPLPYRVETAQPIGVSFVDDGFARGDLHLASMNRDATSPIARTIVPTRHRKGEAGLEMQARLGTATFTLKGPIMTVGD